MALLSRISTLRFGDGVGNFREWHAEAVTEKTAAGGSVDITITQTTGGTTPPGQANTLTLRLRSEGADAIRNFTLDPAAASQTVTFHFTDTGAVGGAARSGTVGIDIHATRTDIGTYDYETDGNPSTEPTGFTAQTVDRGYLISTTTGTITVNNTALGDPAFTGTYAWPDSIFMRLTLAARAYDLSDTIELDIGGIKTNSFTNDNQTVIGDANYDFTTLVDATFTEALTSRLCTATVKNSQLTALPWTDLTTLTTQTIDVDPRVTLSALTVDAPYTTASVHNRGQTVNGLLDVKNARAEGFAPRGTASLVAVDAGTAEDAATFTRTGASYDWALTFATSGNVAPADTVGSAKALRWRDSAANSPQPADTGTLGFLSSLYDHARHMQLDNNTLDPALDVTASVPSSLRFMAVKVTDQRGDPVNGATGTLALRDDGDLVSQYNLNEGVTLTTAAQNGHNGYTPLKAWDSQLPGGGWDFWAPTQFTKDGNTTNMTRSGAGTYDVTLLSIDPDLGVIVGGGVGSVGAQQDHWHPGDDLLVGVALYDNAKKTIIAPDASPAPNVLIGRFRSDTGVAEYLDLSYDWQTLTAAAADVHPLSASPADSRIYTLTIPAAETAAWVEPHIDGFVVGMARKNGTPYWSFTSFANLGPRNGHGGAGYALRIGPLVPRS